MIYCLGVLNDKGLAVYILIIKNQDIFFTFADIHINILIIKIVSNG